jgi:hypothetical protein
MKLAAVQIQALVRQAQDQYIIAFANTVGQSIIGPVQQMDTCKCFNIDKTIS